MRIGVLPLLVLRHPLLRALLVAAWAVGVALVVATGVIAGALLAGAAALLLLLRRWLGGRRRRVADADIIEGEFTVVPREPRTPFPPAG